MVNQILSPKIDVRSLVLHVDDRSNDKTYEFLEMNAGHTFPLVKIRNTTINYTDIKFLELSIGRSFTPSMKVIINDDRKIFMDTDYPMIDDLVTIYIGRYNDEGTLPIHMDMNIINVTPTTAGHVIEARCVLPSSTQRLYGQLSTNEITSFDACKIICETMGLGLVSNITSSTDRDVWLCKGLTRIELLHDLINKMYISDNKYIHAFIDQHYRLNIIELSGAFSEVAENQEVTHDLLSGNELDESEPLVLSNAIFDTTSTQYRIVNFKPVNRAGGALRYAPKALNHVVFDKDYENNTIDINSGVSMIENGSPSDGSMVDMFESGTGAKTEDVYMCRRADSAKYADYIASEKHNQLGKLLMLQTPPHIEVTLANKSNMLVMFNPVTVDIRNSPFRHDIPLNDDDTGQDTDNETASEMNEESVNETFSGDYSITAMDFIYSGRSTMTFKQRLRLHKRFWATSE